MRKQYECVTVIYDYENKEEFEKHKDKMISKRYICDDDYPIQTPYTDYKRINYTYCATYKKMLV